MCRGFEEEEELVLNIKAFYVGVCMNAHTSSTRDGGEQVVGEWMTLCYLPRMNGSPLEINNSSISPNSPAFLTLHRLISSPPPSGCLDRDDDSDVVYYGSRERVKVSHGAGFELYLGEHKVAKGFFTKHHWEHPWKMEWWWGDIHDTLLHQLHLCVTSHHDLSFTSSLEPVKTNTHYTTWTMRKRRSSRLEEIPEETECDLEDDDHDCCCSSPSISNQNNTTHHINIIMEQLHQQEEEDTHDIEMEEVVSWAVDIGIWVMCLGFGLLLSKASSPPKKNAFLPRIITNL